MAKNPFSTGVFSAPNYSMFSWSHGNRISMDAGKIHVIGSEYLDTGEKFDLNSVGNVTRVAPMKAPTLDTYRTDIYAFAVRLRTLGMATRNPWPYEDFFNMRENIDTSKRLPDIPLAILFGINRFRNNTLLENFGLPTFKNLREDYLGFLRKNLPNLFTPVVRISVEEGNVTYIVPSDFDYSIDSLSYSFNGVSYSFRFNGPGGISAFPFAGTLLYYLFYVSKYKDSLFGYFFNHSGGFNLDSDYHINVHTSSALRVDSGSAFNLLDILYEIEKIDSLSVLKDYEDWLLDNLWTMRSFTATIDDSDQYKGGFSSLFSIATDSLGMTIIRSLKDNFPDLPTRNLMVNYGPNGEMIDTPCVPTYFFDSYFKICADWFINTALFNPDDWFIDAGFIFHPRNAYGALGWEQVINTYASSGDLNAYKSAISRYVATDGFVYRYWQNDYFTSCFPTAQAGNAVSIPIDGTIIDLRNANAWQRLKERLNYAGFRFRDVLFAMTGKKTSSAIMDMSEVLGAWSNVINVDSVLQQSESTNGQPLANYAGTALGYRSGGKGCYYKAEEPTVIIFVACIRPHASYFQGLHRKFTRAYVTDYDVAQLANVGEDIVRVSELYFDGDSCRSKTEDETIFGYQRRYGSFMWSPDEVHGDFRGNLDFWHNSRIFGSEPTLSANFLQVRPDEDNLNRIFAVTSDAVNHFYCHFTFSGNVIRHLPKVAMYEL